MGVPIARGIPVEQVMATQTKRMISGTVGSVASNALIDEYDMNPYIEMGIGMEIINITYRGIDSIEVDTTMGITALGGKTDEPVLSDKMKLKTDYDEYSTNIDENVLVVKKQELHMGLAETFKDANYRTVITNEDITVYRSFGYNGMRIKFYYHGTGI